MISEAFLAIEDAAANRGGEPALVPCLASTDPTQPTVLPPEQRVLIAANLRDSEGVAPNLVVQVLTLALAQDALLGSGGVDETRGDGSGSGSGSGRFSGNNRKTSHNSTSGYETSFDSRVFVSIYESGSRKEDKTGAAELHR
jgi:hypothetical protein